MPKLDEIKKLGQKIGNTDEDSFGKKGKILEDYGGRKAIIVLFLLTVLLSFILWIYSNFSGVFSEFFGPSSWTFSR